jgi:hypothetical protein
LGCGPDSPQHLEARVFFASWQSPKWAPFTFFEEELKRAFSPDDPNELRGCGKKEQPEKKEKVVREKEGPADFGSVFYEGTPKSMSLKKMGEYFLENQGQGPHKKIDHGLPQGPYYQGMFPVALKKVSSIKDKVKLS